MAKFTYTARSREGALKKGTVDAANRDQVVELLRQKSLIVVNVEEGGGGVDFSVLSEVNIGGVPLDEKVVFMRQLATMVGAGLPLTNALRLLVSQIKNASFKKSLDDVSKSIEGGKSLGDSMAEHEGIFDRVTVNLVKSGEESGNLEEIFLRLADDWERNRDFQAKVKGALIYPAIIFVAIILVVALLLIFMVPQMEELYNEFDAELPFITQWMIGLSYVVRTFWWLIIIIAGAFGIAYVQYRKSPGGRRVTDTLFLKAPVIGSLQQNVNVAEMTATLGMLLKSGVSITQSLEIASDSMSNVLYVEAMKKAVKTVERGQPFAKALVDPIFPPIVSQMVAVGEETGKVDEILDRLATYFGNEVEYAVNNLTSALEPIILIVVGGVVGVIAVAVYLPIFNIGEVIS